MARLSLVISFFFFFNDTATTEIYTLSLHDALPISGRRAQRRRRARSGDPRSRNRGAARAHSRPRSEEHTSELQSLTNLVCRLLLEKKKKNKNHANCRLMRNHTRVYVGDHAL